MKNRFIITAILCISIIAGPLFAQSMGDLTPEQKGHVLEYMATQIKEKIDTADKLASTPTIQPMVAGASIGPRLSASVVAAISNLLSATCNYNGVCEIRLGESSRNCSDCQFASATGSGLPNSSVPTEAHYPTEPRTGSAADITDTSAVLYGTYSYKCSSCGEDIDDNLMVGFYVEGVSAALKSGHDTVGGDGFKSVSSISTYGLAVDTMTGTFYPGIKNKEKGTFYAKVTGLQPATTYDYRAAVIYRGMNGDQKAYAQNTGTFTTLRAGTTDKSENCSCPDTFNPVCYRVSTYGSSVSRKMVTYNNSCLANCDYQAAQASKTAATIAALQGKSIAWKEVEFAAPGICPGDDPDEIVQKAEDDKKAAEEKAESEKLGTASNARITATLKNVASSTCAATIEYTIDWADEYDGLFISHWIFPMDNNMSELQMKKAFLGSVDKHPWDSSQTTVNMPGKWLNRQTGTLTLIEKGLGEGEQCIVIFGWNKVTGKFVFSDKVCFSCETQKEIESSANDDDCKIYKISDGKGGYVEKKICIQQTEKANNNNIITTPAPVADRTTVKQTIDNASVEDFISAGKYSSLEYCGLTEEDVKNSKDLKTNASSKTLIVNALRSYLNNVPQGSWLLKGTIMKGYTGEDATGTMKTGFVVYRYENGEMKARCIATGEKDVPQQGTYALGQSFTKVDLEYTVSDLAANIAYCAKAFAIYDGNIYMSNNSVCKTIRQTAQPVNPIYYPTREPVDTSGNDEPDTGEDKNTTTTPSQQLGYACFTTKLPDSEIRAMSADGIDFSKYYYVGPVNSEGGCGLAQCFVTQDYNPVYAEMMVYPIANGVPTSQPIEIVKQFSNEALATQCYGAKVITE